MPPADLRPETLRAALIASYPRGVIDPARIRIVRAPGRVNLIGEYTDINEGFVLPAAIDLETRIAFVPTDDRRVELTLLADGARAAFDLDRAADHPGGWLDYVAGTAWALTEAGRPLVGLLGVVGSTLPIGAGLSSSAALELASAWALSGPAGPDVDPLTLARIAQRAENAYVGVQCGLMDQFASASGVAGGALLFDTRTLASRIVPLPLRTHCLVVIDSGSPRALGTSAYNDRRAECERAVAAIATVEPGVRALRDVDAAMLAGARGRLDEVAFRRARHVIGENERVLAIEAALAAGDLDEIGRLWAASHASLRDDFEVSISALDALVEIATATPGVAAARMTGAGFGGCTINLVHRDALEALTTAVAADYPRRTGLAARVIPVEPAAGAGAVTVDQTAG